MTKSQSILPKNTPSCPERTAEYNDQETITRVARLFADGDRKAVETHLRSLDPIKAAYMVMLLEWHFKDIEHNIVLATQFACWLSDTARS